MECKDGILSVSDSVFNEVEQKFTRYATEAESIALAELDRVWNDLQAINEALNPVPGISRDLFSSSSALLLEKFYRKPLLGREIGMQTRWDISDIEQLAKAGFGK
ncbi:MAG: hypothetical protein HC906_16190 [Bacteroidales bacterium]|nr:hypothetical protein [Bacteroidales bacterium]